MDCYSFLKGQGSTSFYSLEMDDEDDRKARTVKRPLRHSVKGMFSDVAYIRLTDACDLFGNKSYVNLPVYTSDIQQKKEDM